ncbi:hypothetical protein FOWG_17757 [Fusarium oxysporum f. sp. lycopersici MN25]|nr:hypothetical protein FOWG_17757 [Fusarium oxysporum f. sp. lycopersici MN25]
MFASLTSLWTTPSRCMALKDRMASSSSGLSVSPILCALSMLQPPQDKNDMCTT